MAMNTLTLLCLKCGLHVPFPWTQIGLQLIWPSMWMSCLEPSGLPSWLPPESQCHMGLTPCLKSWLIKSWAIIKRSLLYTTDFWDSLLCSYVVVTGTVFFKVSDCDTQKGIHFSENTHTYTLGKPWSLALASDFESPSIQRTDSTSFLEFMNLWVISDNVEAQVVWPQQY